MENFFTLRAEKQGHIIDAALAVFGKQGYKKASVADIAEKAQIAKGMVNYYFGSKKNLYLYCAEHCYSIITSEIETGFDPQVTDFFDKMKMMSDIKFAAIKKRPGISGFLTSLYYETDSEVYEDLKELLAKGLEKQQQMVVREADTSRLKDDINPVLLNEFLVLAAEGFAARLQREESVNQIKETENFIQNLHTSIDWMKKYFYKESAE